jgi:hypothetical protein
VVVVADVDAERNAGSRFQLNRGAARYAWPLFTNFPTQRFSYDRNAIRKVMLPGFSRSNANRATFSGEVRIGLLNHCSGIGNVLWSISFQGSPFSLR